MSLFVVGTPIGHPEDLTMRALQTLKEVDIIIGEERREVFRLLKKHQIEGKQVELLNEHTRDRDLEVLVEFCRERKVALVSDCGTPGFCDPGAQLVHLCRARKIEVVGVPGPSSLMTFLSICGVRLDQFIFEGFLPQKREERARCLRNLVKEKRAVILMDTPYRLGSLLRELAVLMPKREAVVGLDLTSENEQVESGTLKEISERFQDQKREFLLLLQAL